MTILNPQQCPIGQNYLADDFSGYTLNCRLYGTNSPFNNIFTLDVQSLYRGHNYVYASTAGVTGAALLAVTTNGRVFSPSSMSYGGFQQYVGYERFWSGFAYIPGCTPSRIDADLFAYLAPYNFLGGHDPYPAQPSYQASTWASRQYCNINMQNRTVGDSGLYIKVWSEKTTSEERFFATIQKQINSTTIVDVYTSPLLAINYVMASVVDIDVFVCRASIRKTGADAYSFYINNILVASTTISTAMIDAGFSCTTNAQPGYYESYLKQTNLGMIDDLYIVGNNSLPSTCAGFFDAVGANRSVVAPSASLRASHFRILQGQKSDADAFAFHNTVRRSI
jgi:hypothetical protein